MADIKLNLQQFLSPKLVQRAMLISRVRLAQAIEMPETEWAKAIQDIEKDPLVRELFEARINGAPIISYKRFGKTNLSNQFYDDQDVNVIGGGGETPEALLSKKRHLLEIIQKIGQNNFERFFLYRNESTPAADIAGACGLSHDQVAEVQDFVLEMSVNAEFYFPSRLLSEESVKPTLTGQIVKKDDGAFEMAFYSPHLARGRYEIHAAELKAWFSQKDLPREDQSRLKKLINILELCNLKQNAFFNVLDYLLSSQKAYLDSKDPTNLSPLSLRQVARILHFSPSTICRVIAIKSVLLPWGEEVFISHLMPGKRKVVLAALEKILLDAKKPMKDHELMKAVADNYGIKVSRRTITTCRHVLIKTKRV